jgi:Spy/CpxP family protein refolding chaperone
MIKLATLSLVAAVALTASSAFAGDMACCASKSGKMECAQIYAKLNLTPEQKTKLDSFQARCEKDGCTEDSMNKFFTAAQGVLSPEQYAQLKSECGSMQHHTEKAGS